jgi:acetyl-CoA hydrolase
VTAAIDLTQFVRPGDTVLVAGATGEPRSLVESLIAQRHAIGAITVFLGPSFTGLFRSEHADVFRYRAIGGVGTTATLTRAGIVDVVPIHLGTIPQLISSGQMPVDVVLVQVTPADSEGRHCLGLMADYLQAAIATARVTLAEVNPRVPRTHGDTMVAATEITAVVHDDRPLIEIQQRDLTADDRAIARYVAERVPDGATVQVGVGATPDAVLADLRGHRDLGFHSGLVSDAVVDLVEAGVITNSRKEIDRSTLIAGALYGTERLYRWADDNPVLQMKPVSYTHDGRVLSVFRSLFAVNSAIEIDLSGQINAEMVSGRHVGVIGGQGAFARAALTSEAGRSIIALPSTARDGAVSRIVARFADGVTTTSRADADLVVTEHGVADLRGRSLRERAERLIAISHPAHRDDLERQARTASAL